MVNISPLSAIIISGLTWLIVGFSLLYKGIFLIAVRLLADPSSLAHCPMLSYFYDQTRNLESSTLFLLFIGLTLGLIKAKLVLSKAVKRTIKTLLHKEGSLKLSDVFTMRYLLLIGLMVLIGISLRLTSIPFDIKSLINVSIGSALIFGAILYFKYAIALRAELFRRK